MEIVLALLFGSNFIFAMVLVYLVRRDEQQKARVERQKREISNRFYEVRVLQEISEKIGYSLNIGSVTETIVHSFENLYDLSTISYALIDKRIINQRTVMKEAVGQKYVEKINALSLASLYELNPNAKGYTVNLQNENASDIKNYIAMHFDPSPESYFTIPLVMNNTVHGVITISSRKKDAFAESDMDVVYQVVRQAEKATQQLEKMIQSENNRLINLVSSLPTPAMLLNRDNSGLSVSAVNAIASTVLKLPPNPGIEDIVWSMDGSIKLKEILEDVYKGGTSVFLKDVVLKNRTYKVYINPVYNIAQSEVIAVTVTLLDVTLEVESEKLREKFTNMVVHELRAPMTSIKGGASLLLKGNLPDEDKEKMLHIISDSSERMLSQINDLLDAAKLEAGKFAVTPNKADINALAQQKVDAFQYMASTKQIRLTSNLDTNIPEFAFDKMRIDQVITNLFSNSLKFTQANGHIEISTAQKDGMVVVSVKDNGMGVPKGKENLLFVPFSQMQSAFRRDGTGLGLYISRGIIESHGGKIWMDSVEGKGTTVSFSLPLNQKIAEEQMPSISSSPASNAQPVHISPVTERVVN